MVQLRLKPTPGPRWVVSTLPVQGAAPLNSHPHRTTTFLVSGTGGCVAAITFNADVVGGVAGAG